MGEGISRMRGSKKVDEKWTDWRAERQAWQGKMEINAHAETTAAGYELSKRRSRNRRGSGRRSVRAGSSGVLTRSVGALHVATGRGRHDGGGARRR